MKFTAQIRSTADLDSRSGEPCGRALRKAADMIDELEAALRPLANSANAYDGVPPPKYFGDTDFETRFPDSAKANVVTVGYLRAARAALDKLEKLNRE